MATTSDWIAAPPDDGHLGAFTVPEDVEQVWQNLDAGEPHPPISTDPSRPHPRAVLRVAPRLELGAFGGTVMLAAASALLTALMVVLGRVSG